MNTRRVLSASAFVLASSLAAHADTLQFSFSGPDTIEFSLPSSISALGPGSVFLGVPVNVNGNVAYGAPDFSDVSYGFAGGFSLYYTKPGAPNISYHSVLTGPQLFTYSNYVDTFTAGTFTLAETTYQATGAGAGSVVNSGNGTLTITDLDLHTSPVPEPSTISLLGMGMLAVGGVRRRFAR